MTSSHQHAGPGPAGRLTCHRCGKVLALDEVLDHLDEHQAPAVEPIPPQQWREVLRSIGVPHGSTRYPRRLDEAELAELRRAVGVTVVGEDDEPEEPAGTPDTQRCPRCQQHQALTAFIPSDRGRAGAPCRDCRNAYRRARAATTRRRTGAPQ